MAIKWMGRYRDFVSAVVKHSNQYNRVANVDSVSFEDKTFSSIEWQILEYVYEHPDDTGNMSVISEALGLATSSFSKSTAKLVRLGLVEKYMVDGNRKNIILRVSEEGRHCYDYIVENQMKPMVRITNTHRVRVTLESSVAVMTTLADRVSSPPMFFAMM